MKAPTCDTCIHISNIDHKKGLCLLNPKPETKADVRADRCSFHQDFHHYIRMIKTDAGKPGAPQFIDPKEPFNCECVRIGPTADYPNYAVKQSKFGSIIHINKDCKICKGTGVNGAA